MPGVLRWLSRKSSRQVFALAWAVLFVDLLFNLLPESGMTRFVAALLGVAVMFGYPFIIVFGFPRPYSSQISRVTCLLALVVLTGMCVASIVDPSAMPDRPKSWAGTLAGILLVPLVFSPFFVATHVLGQVRRALRVHRPLDSIGAGIALFYFAFGGVFFLHSKVSGAVESITNMRAPVGGIPGTGAV